MCGIISILLANSDHQVCNELYEGLNVVQHRGQDAAGIITCCKSRLYQCKGVGLVRDVFTARNMAQLLGNMGVGHVRYPTAGSSSPSEAQPFYVNSPYGIVLAHNGNLTNSDEIGEHLTKVHRHINTDSDSEMLLNVLANNLQQTGKLRIDEHDVFNAVKGVFERCRGGYACTSLITGYGIMGFRDPNGIRPLVFGKRESSDGTDYMFCSETVGLDALGFTYVDDVAPGEVVLVTKTEVFRKICIENAKLNPCIFEYVYFARPDSIIDRVSVYRARLAMGEGLAETIQKDFSHLNIDVVIPVPDTSRTSALQCAYKLGIKYREGLIKNRYIGRTFIMPGQALRKKAVRRKLNAMPLEFQGKNVLLVDDSIVRGTTSMEIILMAREAGASKVFFASCSPPIRYPNVYGIDMPIANELVAHGRTDEEIAKEIGADAVIYLPLDKLVHAVHQFNPNIQDFDCSVFCGKYVTGDVTENYLNSLKEKRADDAKSKKTRLASADVDVSLFNHV